MYYSINDENVTEIDWNRDSKAFFHFLPSFYVNFDSKIFYSLYTESLSFEAYVPDGWIGAYKDFFELIDEQYRFWIDNDGNDILINE